MTSEQIKLLKEEYMKKITVNGKEYTLAAYMRLCLDGGFDFVTSKDCVVYDEANELIHCISVNEDLKSQAAYPIKLISAEYGILQQLEAIVSKPNFEKLLDEGYFSTLLNDEQKEYLKNWAKKINNAAIVNNNPNNYYAVTSDTKYEPVVAKVRAADGTEKVYSNMAEAVKNIKNGDILKLNDDITISEPITLAEGVSATIDLNGKSIKSTGSNIKQLFNITTGKLEITGEGSIETDKEVFRLNGVDGGNPELIIGKDVTVESTGNFCLFAKGKCTATIKGTVKTSGGEFATITGNGLAANAGTVFNIEGAKIINSTDNGLAFYHPQDGELNIKDSYIAADCCIYMKSGVLNVESSNITATGEKHDYAYNGSGGDSTGDAIILDFCDYPGTAPVANIISGNITSIYGSPIECYDKEGNIAPEDSKANVNVSGGNYTEAFSSNYLAEGYEFVVKSNGVVTVAAAD